MFNLLSDDRFTSPQNHVCGRALLSQSPSSPHHKKIVSKSLQRLTYREFTAQPWKQVAIETVNFRPYAAVMGFVFYLPGSLAPAGQRY